MNDKFVFDEYKKYTYNKNTTYYKISLIKILYSININRRKLNKIEMSKTKILTLF